MATFARGLRYGIALRCRHRDCVERAQHRLYLLLHVLFESQGYPALHSRQHSVFGSGMRAALMEREM